MPKARLRYDESGCYYHCFNRISGPDDDLPFGELEREKLFKLAWELSEYYLVEILSFVSMSNHYHCVLYAPPLEKETPLELVKQRWYKRYGKDVEKGKCIVPDWKSKKAVRKIYEQMRDVSTFIGRLQWGFTMWYKHTNPEGQHLRGSRWQSRYKNTILEGGNALWGCILYAELNPIRAKMVRDLKGHRAGTYGQYRGRGRHPFAENIKRHICSSAKGFTDVDEVMNSMHKMICIVAAFVFDGVTPMQKDEALSSLLQRSSFWCRGGILGSEEFVRQMSSRFERYCDKTRRKLTKWSEGLLSFRGSSG